MQTVGSAMNAGILEGNSRVTLFLWLVCKLIRDESCITWLLSVWTASTSFPIGLGDVHLDRYSPILPSKGLIRDLSKENFFYCDPFLHTYGSTWIFREGRRGLND